MGFLIAICGHYRKYVIIFQMKSNKSFVTDKGQQVGIKIRAFLWYSQTSVDFLSKLYFY